MRQLGKYDILEEIGRGGFGIVYKARDRSLDRLVALKVLHPQLTVDTSFLERFRKEARSLARINHPNVVTVHEVGEAEGRVYIAMEYLPGGSLADRLEKGPLPIKEALKVTSEVASGLGAGHVEGLIHRDVKPGNILFNKRGEAVIADFGLAKALSISSSSVRSSVGAVGTPYYRAPELWNGTPPPSPATDEYALACVFYEMITGQILFDGDTPMMVMTMHAHGPDFSSDTNLQVRLLKVLEKVLSKDPTLRYQSMERFVKVLTQSLSIQPEREQEYSSKPPEQFVQRTASEGKPTRDPKPSSQMGAESSFEKPVVKSRQVDRQYSKSSTRVEEKKNTKWVLWGGLGIAGVISVIVVFILIIIGIVSLWGNRPVAQAPVVDGPAEEYPEETEEEIREEPEEEENEEVDLVDSEKADINKIPDIESLDLINSGNIEKLIEIEDFGLGINKDIKLSPDGKILAVGSSIGIYFYDSYSLDEIKVVAPNNYVNSIAFSPDGKLIASGEMFGYLHIWDFDSGSELFDLEAHMNAVNKVAFSPDGRLLASVSYDGIEDMYGVVYFWDVDTGELLREIRTPNEFIRDIAFSPDGKIIAVSGEDQIHLWDPISGEQLGLLEGYSTGPIAFSPDGSELASAGYDGHVHLWDLDNRKVALTFYKENYFFDTVFSPDGEILAAADTYGNIFFWNLYNDEELTTIEDYTGGVQDLVFLLDGKTIFTSSHDFIIRQWNVVDGSLLNSIEGYTDHVLSLAFSPDGSMLAAGGWESEIQLWDVNKFSKIHTLIGHESVVDSIAFSPDGNSLVSGSRDRTVRIWDVKSGEVIRIIEGQTLFWCVAFSPDGRTIASGNSDGEIAIWDISNGEKILSMQGHTDTVYDLAYSPDGKIIASGGRDRTVRIWDTNSGTELFSLEKHTDGVTAIAFSPDGSLLASGGYDGNLFVWRVENGTIIMGLNNHSPNNLSFSPDGSILAAGIYSSFNLWDVDSGTLLKSMYDYYNWESVIDYSPDGKLIATAGWNGKISLWGIPSQ